MITKESAVSKLYDLKFKVDNVLHLYRGRLLLPLKEQRGIDAALSAIRADFKEIAEIVGQL